MEQQSSNSKNMLVGVGAFLLVAFALWFFFFRNTEVEVAYDDFGNPIQSEVVGKDLIDILTELQSVTLDASIFKSAGFVNLTDFAVDLQDQPKGRANPFESLKGAAAVPAATQSAVIKKN